MSESRREIFIRLLKSKSDLDIIEFTHDAVRELIEVLEEPERKTGRWNRLMMYLADLQLTYSPGWGANGCGDEKLYEFVTGLIEELEKWEDGGET